MADDGMDLEKLGFLEIRPCQVCGARATHLIYELGSAHPFKAIEFCREHFVQAKQVYGVAEHIHDPETCA